MNEEALAEQDLHRDKDGQVGRKLGQPDPEGQVNVEHVLLLPLLDDFRSQDPGSGRSSRVDDDVAEGQRVHHQLRNAEADEADQELGAEADGVPGQPGKEFRRLQVGIEGPDLGFVAKPRAFSPSGSPRI